MVRRPIFCHLARQEHGCRSGGTGESRPKFPIQLRTFVCNHVLYGLLDTLAHDSKKRRGGFIHVPYLPQQAARLKDQPSMGLSTIVEGLKTPWK